MTPKPIPTRAMRVFMVVVMAFGVAVMGWCAFSLFKAERRLPEHGLATSLGTGVTVLAVGAFFYMVWLLIGAVRDSIREWPTAPQSQITSQTVCAAFREAFTGQATEARPAYRYGMLAFVLALLAWNIQFLLTLPPHYTGDRYMNLLVVLMLLFNHLSGSFRWPVTVTLALRVLAYGWVLMGTAYIYYVSQNRF